jgi:hypothetical protein
MEELGRLMLLIGIYVVHVFVCRYFDLKAVDGREKAPDAWDGIKNETTPALWFIPIIGIIFCTLFLVVVWFHNWKNTPLGKRFLTGEK